MTSVDVRPFGVTRGHVAEAPRPVLAYNLDNGRGITASILGYGAILHALHVPNRHGRPESVVVGLPDVASYESCTRNPNLAGAVLGRYARCVAGGRFALDGTAHQLQVGSDGHHFHGGSLGFHRFVWDAEAASDSQSARLCLRLTRPHGDMGYPGAVTIEAEYHLDVDGRLAITFRATTDRSTILALTSHVFWRLGGRGTVDGHILAMNASRIVATDAQHIPQGPLVDLTGGPLDRRLPRRIGRQRLDHCYRLDDPTWAATLYDPASGRSMHITTDQPALAVYSGDGLPTPRAGLCLQTGALPDAPNRPDFPSVRLDPSQVYYHNTVYLFSTA